MLPYDPRSLKTIDACRLVAERAKRSNDNDAYKAATDRIIELVGEEYADEPNPLIREAYQGLAVLEMLKSALAGKKRRSTRTRQSLERSGVVTFMTGRALANDGDEKDGFTLMVDNHFSNLISEYLIVKYQSQFSKEAVEAALERLHKYNIELPEQTF